MSEKDSFVKFDKVDKSYDGEILVVKHLNLDVHKGEYYDWTYFINKKCQTL